MRMLYRVPGKHKLHGIMCDYCTVPDTAQAIAAAEAQGWRRTPALAEQAKREAALDELARIDQEIEALGTSIEAAEGPIEPQTRDDLLTIARELGIKVDGRWSDARLRKEVGL